MSTEDRKSSNGTRTGRVGVVLCVLLIAIGALLVLEHRAHLLGSWPLLLILGLCIGMHFFMHGGHDHDRDDTHSDHDRESQRGQ